MVPVELPRLETEDLYENMFAMPYYVSDPGRAMEILTYINTNVEIRNLLLYGIEGKNYRIVNSKYKNPATGEIYVDENESPYEVISPFADSNYKMDIFKTGNTLIVTPDENTLPIIKDYATKQNRESLVSQDMTFILTADVDTKKLDDIRELSADVYKELMEIMNDKEKSVDDLAKFIDDSAKEVDENESFKFHTNEKNKKGFAAVYKTWCNGKNVIEA